MDPISSGTNKEDETVPNLYRFIQLRRSKWEWKAKSFGPNFQLYVVVGSRDDIKFQ